MQCNTGDFVEAAIFFTDWMRFLTFNQRCSLTFRDTAGIELNPGPSGSLPDALPIELYRVRREDRLRFSLWGVSLFTESDTIVNVMSYSVVADGTFGRNFFLLKASNCFCL
jgi:hypothetical protein